MQNSLRSIFGVLASACATLAAGFAAAPHLPGTIPSPGGLQLQLITSGYRFAVADATHTRGATDVSIPANFAVSASLQNRSATDIVFEFPSPGAAERKFTFRVFDSEGKEIWRSDADAGPEPTVMTEAKLRHNDRWRRTLAVPLKLKDKPLDAGIYTLEAVVDADKQIGATAIFEVAGAAPPPDPTKTGITGTVWKSTGPPGGEAPDVPAAGAQISIMELPTRDAPTHLPFTWSGKADADGKFLANTPPGAFRVTASISEPGDNGVVYPPRSVEVHVEANKFSDVSIVLTPGAPPPGHQGIKGQVFIAIGDAAETPLAGAHVSIVQLTSPSGPVILIWEGQADGEGRFARPTPVGHFRVTASTASTADTPPVTASVEVNVEADHWAEVRLHLKKAPPPPPTVQGIRGVVLIVTDANGEVPASGARVVINQLDSPTGPVPFHWEGNTNDAGKFEKETPVGRFRVGAFIPNSNVSPAAIEVSVASGAFREVTLHLHAWPPPPVQQGIRGLVLIANIQTGPGAPPEVPLPGALVKVDQLNVPNGPAVFHWAGVTNGEGRFHVPTPAGSFKVTAAPPPNTAFMPPPVTADVTVEAGRIAEVTLHLGQNTP